MMILCTEYPDETDRDMGQGRVVEGLWSSTGLMYGIGRMMWHQVEQYAPVWEAFGYVKDK